MLILVVVPSYSIHHVVRFFPNCHCLILTRIYHFLFLLLSFHRMEWMKEQHRHPSEDLQVEWFQANQMPLNFSRMCHSTYMPYLLNRLQANRSVAECVETFYLKVLRVLYAVWLYPVL